MPAENNILNNHIYIPKTRFNKSKKVKRKFIPNLFEGQISSEEMLRSSVKLIKELDTVIGLHSDYKQSFPSKYIFKITTHIDLDQIYGKKNLESLGLEWLNPTNQHEVVVALSKDKVNSLKEKIGKYGENGKYKTYLNNIFNLEPVYPIQSVSTNITKLDDSTNVTMEIDFYCGLTLEDYHKSVDFIKTITGEERIRYEKTEPEMPFIRLITNKKDILRIASSLPSIRKVDTVPEMKVVSGDTKRVENIEFETAPDNLKAVMVIDCGVSHEHEGIKNVLIFRKSYLRNSSTEDSDPEGSGHGTSVAGLAAYGMISPSSRRLIPTSKIAVAKVLDDKNKSSEVPLEVALGQIVNDGVSKGIRIYSLTVLYPREAREISKLAYIIDTLSKVKDVVFIISTGNLLPEKLEELYRSGVAYPSYLTNNPESVILEGAEACCAITVGGIAHTSNSRAIAKKNEASPFTRVGPTPDGRLKPDLVYFAGNILQTFATTEELSLLSLNHDPNSGIYSTNNIGTSFSTPQIANMASQVLREYPNASANLIRALLIHSADMMDEFRNIAEPNFVYGFGFPKIDNAIKSLQYAPTMIFEGEIEPDEFADVKIHVPKEMASFKGSKFIKITLAYDPKVSNANSKLNYSLLNLSFRIIRKNKTDNDTKIGRNDRGWQLQTYRQIENNTIKKDIFQWERGHIGEDWVIRVESSLKGSRSDIPKQRFALAITIQGSRKDIDLYTPIKTLFESETIKATELNRLQLQTQRFPTRQKK